MRVTKSTVIRACAVCERTLLQGEYTIALLARRRRVRRRLPALPRGRARLRLGSRGRPDVARAVAARAPQAPALGAAPRRPGQHEPEPVVSEPILRRLSDSEAALVEAADLFNASLFRRTIEGVARALGAPLVSIVPLSGVNSELVLTFAWEITWYQYRVMPEAAAADPARRPRRRHRPRSSPRSRTGTPSSTRAAASSRALCALAAGARIAAWRRRRTRVSRTSSAASGWTPPPARRSSRRARPTAS